MVGGFGGDALRKKARIDSLHEHAAHQISALRIRNVPAVHDPRLHPGRLLLAPQTNANVGEVGPFRPIEGDSAPGDIVALDFAYRSIADGPSRRQRQSELNRLKGKPLVRSTFIFVGALIAEQQLPQVADFTGVEFEFALRHWNELYRNTSGTRPRLVGPRPHQERSVQSQRRTVSDPFQLYHTPNQGAAQPDPIHRFSRRFRLDQIQRMAGTFDANPGNKVHSMPTLEISSRPGGIRTPDQGIMSPLL